ncbi:MAG: DNA internalization-related competence protein ComEC/Rec2 [Dehalococcoidia bacterium]|nr:DNA internalization-related competence protein ComEC/Rec2 [Dehalococcoidia bacterium]
MLLPYFALAWIVGLAAAGVWSSPSWMAGTWFLAAVPAAYVVGGRRGAGMAVIGCVLALTSSALMVQALGTTPTSSLAEEHAGADVVLVGHVASPPDPGLRTVRYRIDVVSIEPPATIPPHGAVLVTVSQYTEWLPGDVVRLEGQLDLPTDDLNGFDYRAYLLGRGIVSTMAFPKADLVERGGFSPERASTSLQLRMEHALRRSLPEPEASLAAGIAIGRDDALPQDVVDAFRASGLAHLTAVSGSNVAILAALVFLVATPVVGRRWAILPAAAVLALYLIAAGLAPTVVRSTIMAWALLGGVAMGRPQSGLAALGLAAIVMTAHDPRLAQDVGFQLSLTATAGLIVLAPWIDYWLMVAVTRASLAGFVGRLPVQAFSFTTAATIATLPVVATTFGRVSIAGLWANVIAEPVFVVAFPLSVATGAAGWLHSDIGWAVGLGSYYPLRFVLVLADRAAALPGASTDTGGVGSTWAALSYSAYVVLGWFLYRRFPPEVRWTPPTRCNVLTRRAITAITAGAVAVWVGASSLGPMGGPGVLEVVVLDVGQGDATLIRTPGGRNVLIDGGPSDIVLARELGAVLPHWERRLDLVVLSHSDEDHVAGLAGLLQRFSVGQTASNGVVRTTNAASLFRARAGSTALLGAGQEFVVDGVQFTVLWPPAGSPDISGNDASVVLRVTYGETSVLLTGDIEAPGEAALMASGVTLAADVLKVPHHGGGTSLAGFSPVVGPKAAAISVGAGNPYGHPADETLSDLAGAAVYRTDEDGRIRFRSDGKIWTVRTER